MAGALQVIAEHWVLTTVGSLVGLAGGSIALRDRLWARPKLQAVVEYFTTGGSKNPKSPYFGATILLHVTIINDGRRQFVPNGYRFRVRMDKGWLPFDSVPIPADAKFTSTVQDITMDRPSDRDLLRNFEPIPPLGGEVHGHLMFLAKGFSVPRLHAMAGIGMAGELHTGDAAGRRHICKVQLKGTILAEGQTLKYGVGIVPKKK